ncbi:methionyl-tRNA formyltransferase [Magnetospirillum sp. SS-4]|uniref:methionyl-tRNA formyltransferase n=1 Tax=Magnetospirillum sp. SS-4 TaxID=2681465 RepID=UPI00137DAC28|nr:formyltransferase family protein [Magnetospirillum sp. SS-4]CAA7617723.1 putative Methionyl-tRNA formyltransferase [Magnetospirillum sp. SS-4]
MNAGFVCFADSWGLRLLRPFAADCVGVVVDPSRVNPAEAASLLEWKMPVLTHPRRDGRGEMEADILSLAPALGVIASYSRILWPEVLTRFPLGVINLHGGPLPAYRGANVLQWAIINGEASTAATLHYVDSGVDTGPVIAASRVPIAPTDSAVDVQGRLTVASAALLTEWLPRAMAGRVPASPQPESAARTWPRRRPEDGCIDWSWPDERIYNLVRALVAPWPGARYRDRDGRWVVVKSMLSLDDIAALRRTLT